METFAGLPVTGTKGQSRRGWTGTQRSAADFRRILDAFFAKGYESITWNQADDRYNDQNLYFEVELLSVVRGGVHKFLKYAEDYGADYFGEAIPKPPDAIYADMVRLAEDIESTEDDCGGPMGEFQAVLMSAFGPCATVTATPEGFTIA